MSGFKPVKQEKTVISIRINMDMLDKIDELSLKTEISRNEFIVQCIEYAISNYKSEQQENE